MSSPRNRGRRVPPKARGSRPASRPTAEAGGTGPAGGAPDGAGGGGDTAPRTAAGRAGGTGDADVREPVGPVPGSRAANRAAKRAALGVRPKTTRHGRPVSPPRRGSNRAVLGLAVAALGVGAGVLLLGNPFAAPGPSPSAVTYGDGTCPTSQPAALPAGAAKHVTIETTLGSIVVRVDPSLSPIATGNFVALAECSYYDGVVFHRLVPGFVIQGGDPDGTGGGPGPGYRIADEPITGTYRRGTVAMARTPNANSQGSQFFIVLSDGASAQLTQVDPARGYAILGEVITGMDVVDAIAAMPNSGNDSGNRALQPVAMTRVTVADAPAASASPVPPSTAPTPSGPASAAPPPPSPATTP